MLNLRLDQIIKGLDLSSEITNAQKNILGMAKPNEWNINVLGNKERSMRVDFEKIMLAINGYDFTVFQFYAKLEQLEEQNNDK